MIVEIKFENMPSFMRQWMATPYRTYVKLRRAFSIFAGRYRTELVQTRMSGRKPGNVGLFRRTGELERTFKTGVTGRSLDTLGVEAKFGVFYAEIHETGAQLRPRTVTANGVQFRSRAAYPATGDYYIRPRLQAMKTMDRMMPQLVALSNEELEKES